MRSPDSRRLPRFASRRRKPPPPGLTTRVLEVVHKLLTAGAALATILRLLF
jgi:hypothetical protein